MMKTYFFEIDKAKPSRKNFSVTNFDSIKLAIRVIEGSSVLTDYTLNGYTCSEKIWINQKQYHVWNISPNGYYNYSLYKIENGNKVWELKDIISTVGTDSEMIDIESTPLATSTTVGGFKTGNGVSLNSDGQLVVSTSGSSPISRILQVDSDQETTLSADDFTSFDKWFLVGYNQLGSLNKFNYDGMKFANSGFSGYSAGSLISIVDFDWMEQLKVVCNGTRTTFTLVE